VTKLPMMPEPIALGAVVRNGEGLRFVRWTTDPKNGTPWMPDPEPDVDYIQTCTWYETEATIILSGGAK